jgi:hypothetical protein
MNSELIGKRNVGFPDLIGISGKTMTLLRFYELAPFLRDREERISP